MYKINLILSLLKQPLFVNLNIHSMSNHALQVFSKSILYRSFILTLVSIIIAKIVFPYISIQ
ncbi:hypothetical protein HMP0015_0944, partial [Acinetobacter haemolyticus ATCC 19194]